jgi:hypothetical protein
MTPDFVRYGPDVERADPDFEQNLQTVLEGMKRNRERRATAWPGAKSRSSTGCRMRTRKASMQGPDATRRWCASRTASGTSGRTSS